MVRLMVSVALIFSLCMSVVVDSRAEYVEDILGNSDWFEEWVIDGHQDNLEPDYFRIAVINGYTDTLQLLFQYYQGEKDRYFNAVMRKAVISAVRYNRFDCLTIMLNNGVGLDYEETWHAGVSPLHQAIRDGNLQMVQFLIKAGATADYGIKEDSLSFMDSVLAVLYYRSLGVLFSPFNPVAALSSAVENDCPEIFRYLYTHRPTFNFTLRHRYRKTALYSARNIHSVAMAKVYQELGIPLDKPFPKESESPLYEALKKEDLALIDYFLDEVHVALDGVSELLLLVSDNDAVQLRRLLSYQKKRNPDWFVRGGLNKSFSAFGHPHEKSNLLDMALVYRAFEAIEVLLDFGVKVCAEDVTQALRCGMENQQVLALVERTKDPLEAFYDALAFKRYDLAELLLDAGAPFNPASEEAAEALHRAAYWRKLGGVKLLLTHGVPSDVHDRDQETALYAALLDDEQKGLADVVAVLCQAGADLQYKVEGKSYLQMAFEKNHVEAGRILLEAGATDPTFTDLHRAVLLGQSEQLQQQLQQEKVAVEQLNPLLVHAVTYGKVKIAAILLAAGANPDQVASEGNGGRLLEIAIGKNHHDIAELLLLYGADPVR
jgi:ankyrin repeat protein